MLEAFRWGPSPHSAQPAEIIVINDPTLIQKIADLTTKAARIAYADEDYWKRTYSWLRFSKEESESKGDGIYVDKVPALLKPFIQKILSPLGFRILNQLGLTAKLAEENYGDLVRKSPLVLAVVQDSRRKAPGRRGGLWGLLGIGAAIENIWLTATAFHIGCQPITLPFESNDITQEIEKLLRVPETHTLLFLLRMGYVEPEAKRPAIGFTSRARRKQTEWVHYNSFQAEPKPHSDEL